MKLSEVINLYNAFQKMSDCTLTACEGYDIGMVMNKLEPHVKAFEEQRNKLVISLGVEENGTYTVAPENKEGFIKEIVELENKEVNLEIKEKIKLKKEHEIQAKIIWAVMDYIELV
jgi:hypothetical protein